MLCNQCQKETKNPKFCSTTCASLFNSGKRKRNFTRINPQKVLLDNKKVYLCCDCKTLLNHRGKLCDNCRYKDITIEEATYYKHHRSNAFTLIRFRARRSMKIFNLKKVCYNCSYDKHIEVCHIKPINQFEKTTLLSIVNDPSNLTILCPNCHWEFDHGLLEKEIKTIKDVKDKEEFLGYNPKKKIYKKYERLPPNKYLYKCNTCESNYLSSNRKSKYCSLKCATLNNRKAQRPTKEQLEQDLKESNFLALGKKYGVSDNAIRKWAKSYGLPSTKREKMGSL